MVLESNILTEDGAHCEIILHDYCCKWIAYLLQASFLSIVNKICYSSNYISCIYLALLPKAVHYKCDSRIHVCLDQELVQINLTLQSFSVLNSTHSPVGVIPYSFQTHAVQPNIGQTHRTLLRSQYTKYVRASCHCVHLCMFKKKSCCHESTVIHHRFATSALPN